MRRWPEVAKQVASKLEGFECLLADHVSDECVVHGSMVAHDLICKLRPARGRGLVSVEVELREVKKRKPSSINWQGTPESKARALWNAALVVNRESGAAGCCFPRSFVCGVRGNFTCGLGASRW